MSISSPDLHQVVHSAAFPKFVEEKPDDMSYGFRGFGLLLSIQAGPLGLAPYQWHQCQPYTGVVIPTPKNQKSFRHYIRVPCLGFRPQDFRRRKLGTPCIKALATALDMA